MRHLQPHRGSEGELVARQCDRVILAQRALRQSRLRCVGGPVVSNEVAAKHLLDQLAEVRRGQPLLPFQAISFEGGDRVVNLVGGQDISHDRSNCWTLSMHRPSRRWTSRCFCACSLPVIDLNASIALYEAVGFEQDVQFSDDISACMAWSEAAPNSKFSAPEEGETRTAVSNEMCSDQPHSPDAGAVLQQLSQQIRNRLGRPSASVQRRSDSVCQICAMVGLKGGLASAVVEFKRPSCRLHGLHPSLQVVLAARARVSRSRRRSRAGRRGSPVRRPCRRRGP